jgi:hypothetical protein
MRLCVILFVCALLSAGHAQLIAQVEARHGVDRLPWRPGAAQGTVSAIGNLWRPDYHVGNLFLAVGIYSVTVTDAAGRTLHQQMLPVIR